MAPGTFTNTKGNNNGNRSVIFVSDRVLLLFVVVGEPVVAVKWATAEIAGTFRHFFSRSYFTVSNTVIEFSTPICDQGASCKIERCKTVQGILWTPVYDWNESKEGIPCMHNTFKCLRISYNSCSFRISYLSKQLYFARFCVQGGIK